MKKITELLMILVFISLVSCSNCPFHKLQNTKRSTLKKDGFANTLKVFADLKPEFKKIGATHISMFDSLTNYSDYDDYFETHEQYKDEFLEKRNGLVDPLCYYWERSRDNSLDDDEKRKVRHIADSLVIDFYNFIKIFEHNMNSSNKTPENNTEHKTLVDTVTNNELKFENIKINR